MTQGTENGLFVEGRLGLAISVPQYDTSWVFPSFLEHVSHSCAPLLPKS